MFDGIKTIMEEKIRINPCNDYQHSFQCGCYVKWTGESRHRAAIVYLCQQHETIDHRDRVYNEAKREFELAKMSQPTI